MTVRGTVKQILEHGALVSGAASASRRRRRDDVLVLAYHNIVPDGAAPVGDRSLHLPQRDFARQLDLLMRTHDIVPLADVLVQGSRTRTPSARQRPRAVVTFDDAYRGAMTAGLQELQSRRLPSTVFVAPGWIGGGAFWWDTLTAPDAAALAHDVREHALRMEHGKHPQILRWAEQRGMRTYQIPAYATCASETELDAALERHPGVTYGSHTWSHPNLTALPAEELTHELAAPRQWLARYGARSLPLLSYPYGLANAAVREAATRAGYEAAFMIEGGWITDDARNRYALPRLNVPAGVSPQGFALRAAGLIAH